MCDKWDFFEWTKVTETHPDEYYFERIDVFDNALVRSFFGGGHRGPGLLLYSEVTRRPVRPFL